MKEVLQNILKVNDPEKSGDEDKWSQSRIYLFISFLVMIGIIIGQLFIDVSVDRVIQSLEYSLYAILIFSGYAISGKGMKTFEKIKGK